MARVTLGVVQDGSEDPPGFRYGSVDPWGNSGWVGDPR